MYNKMKIVGLASILLLSSFIYSQTLSIQGVMRDQLGNTVNDGSYSINFSLHDAVTDGNQLWSETISDVNVKFGVYSVDLGAVNSMANLSFTSDTWLGIAINGQSEISTRIKLGNSPYALSANGSENIFSSGGNVGIGTKTPDANLVVVDDGETVIKLNSGEGQVGSLLFKQNTETQWRVESSASDNALKINNENSGNSLTILQDGKVGIGTISPQSQLHVAGDVVAEGMISLTGENSELNMGENFTVAVIDSSSFGVKAGVNWALSITNEGNVGFNTDAPTKTLDVNGNIKLTGDGILRFSDGTTLATGSLGGGDAGSMAGLGDIMISADSDTSGTGEIRFNIGNETKMIIKQDGKVGIGVENPTTALDIAGDINYSGDLMNNGSTFGSGLWNEEVLDAGFDFPLVDENLVTYYGEFEGHHYFISNSLTVWADVIQQCNQQGGHLVTISSQEENDFVDPMYVNHIWLGLTDEASEGNWVWENGEPVIYTNWADGEPNNYGTGEDYCLMRPDGTWGDYTTQWSNKYVLEFDSATQLDDIPALVYSAGNVGVGTSTPEVALHVTDVKADEINVNGSVLDLTAIDASNFMYSTKLMYGPSGTYYEDVVRGNSYDGFNYGIALSTGDKSNSTGRAGLGAYNTSSDYSNGVYKGASYINGVSFIYGSYNGSNNKGYIIPHETTTGIGKIGTQDARFVGAELRDCFVSNYYNFSDRRVKKNIIGINNVLERVLQLRGVHYAIDTDTHPLYKDVDADKLNELTGINANYGFIAQELKELFPEMVQYNKDTGLYEIVNYHQMASVITEAVQEYKTEHQDGIKNDITALEERLKALQKEGK